MSLGAVCAQRLRKGAAPLSELLLSPFAAAAPSLASPPSSPHQQLLHRAASLPASWRTSAAAPLPLARSLSSAAGVAAAAASTAVEAPFGFRGPAGFPQALPEREGGRSWSVLRPCAPGDKSTSPLRQGWRDALNDVLGPRLYRSASTRTAPAARRSHPGEAALDVSTFLDGCRHAVATVLQLHGARDYHALRNLVSERVLDNIRGEHDSLARGGQRVSLLETTVNDVRLVNVNVWGCDAIREFDAQKARRAGVDDAWVVSSVEVDATVHVTLMDALGEPVAHHDLPRVGTWLFARGPLPQVGSEEPRRPWFVLGWI